MKIKIVQVIIINMNLVQTVHITITGIFFLFKCVVYNPEKKQPIPIVPYTDSQESSLNNPLFCQLMMSLGVYKNKEVDVFPRIPHSWTVHDYIQKASQLGDIPGH